MTTVYVIWTDYEACEIFATREDAENFCYNTYGPDKTKWQDIEARKLQPIKRDREKKYIAIAWWPDWTYTKPPTEPYVAVAYGEKPYVYDEDKKAIKFTATGMTEAAAEQAVTALATVTIPAYEYAQSSNTTSGVLAVYRRADFRGRVGPY